MKQRPPLTALVGADQKRDACFWLWARLGAIFNFFFFMNDHQRFCVRRAELESSVHAVLLPSGGFTFIVI